MRELQKWHKDGGLMLMGYEMFRLLVCHNPKHARRCHAPTAAPLTALPLAHQVDPRARSENSTTKAPSGAYTSSLRKILQAPGADMVICDEGHRLKDAKSRLCQATALIETKRRIVLTG